MDRLFTWVIKNPYRFGKYKKINKIYYDITFWVVYGTNDKKFIVFHIFTVIEMLIMIIHELFFWFNKQCEIIT